MQFEGHAKGDDRKGRMKKEKRGEKEEHIQSVRLNDDDDVEEGDDDDNDDDEEDI